MSRARRSRMRGALGERVDRLARQIRKLQRDVDALEAAIAAGLHASQLVLEDDTGQPRIIARAGRDHGSIEIVSRSGIHAAAQSVEMFAIDRAPGIPSHVGVAFARGGDVVAVLELVEGRPPQFWTDDGLGDPTA